MTAITTEITKKQKHKPASLWAMRYRAARATMSGPVAPLSTVELIGNEVKELDLGEATGKFPKPTEVEHMSGSGRETQICAPTVGSLVG